MTLGRSLFIVAAVMSSMGCHAVDDLFCSGAGCEWTKEEWTRVQSLSNVKDSRGLPALPGDSSNRYLDPQMVPQDDLIDLGRRFYFDPRFSGPATLSDSIGRPVPFARAPKGTAIGIACADCHNPARAGGDFTSQPNTVSIGAGWYDVNGQQTMNAVFFADYNGFPGGRSKLYWNGRTEALWAQAAQVNESGFSMNGDRANTFWVILEDERYRDDYNRLFGTSLDPADYQGPGLSRHARPDKFNAGLNDAWTCLSDTSKELVTRTQVNFGKAIEAYERTLLAGSSAFDQFVGQGPGSDAISPAAKRGLHLFVGKASCVDCHNGYLLSDGDFHNIGVPQTGDHVPTAQDCPKGSARCDCTPGAETNTCLPAGAWSGWKKLVEEGVAKSNDPKSRFASASFTRNSEWSDDNQDPKVQLSQYCIQTDASFKGAWRTPSLRDVALTAPYMHDGYYKTLDDVVWHYNAGGTASGTDPFPAADMTPANSGADAGIGDCDPTGRPRGRAVQIKPLGLTDEEVSDVVEFLKTLNSAAYQANPDAAPFDAGASPDVGTAACAPSMDGGTQ
jgi:cytochrome c peroxidase